MRNSCACFGSTDTKIGMIQRPGLSLLKNDMQICEEFHIFLTPIQNKKFKVWEKIKINLKILKHLKKQKRKRNQGSLYKVIYINFPASNTNQSLP